MVVSAPLLTPLAAPDSRFNPLLYLWNQINNRNQRLRCPHRRHRAPQQLRSNHSGHLATLSAVAARRLVVVPVVVIGAVVVPVEEAVDVPVVVDVSLVDRAPTTAAQSRRPA